MPRPDARVSIRHCDLSVVKEDGMGLLVAGDVSVEDCAINTTGAKACGIAVAGAATCAVRRCRFAGEAFVAVHVLDDASATVLGSTVTGPCTHAFVLNGTARLAAQDCSVDGAEIAAHVHAPGGVFTTKRVKLRGRRACVNLLASPWVRGRRTVVKLVDSALSSGETGIWAADTTADVTVLRCSVDAAETGVLLAGPVKARIKGGSISGGDIGVAVGAIVDLEGPCAVCGLGGEHAVQAAAAASLAGGCGRGSAAAPRCTHEGAIARLTMADCKVTRCSTAGVRVHVLGRLKASGVTADGCGHGFCFDFTHCCSFESCRAVGCGVGVRDRCRGVSEHAHDDDGAEPVYGVEVVPK